MNGIGLNSVEEKGKSMVGESGCAQCSVRATADGDVENFDEACFNRLVDEGYRIRREVGMPYCREDWKTSGANVRKLKPVLERIARQLKGLIHEERLVPGNGTVVVKVAKGVTYYPRKPWIGVFIGDETARNGIYPVLAFTDECRGFYVGCADSMASAQPGFAKECYTRQERSEGNLPYADEIDYDDHLARNPHWFSSGQTITRENLVSALRAALEVYGRVREIAPLDKNVQKYDWCKVVEVDSVSDWLAFLRKMDKAGCRWAFRGQGNAQWELSSGLERAIEVNCPHPSESEAKRIWKLERAAICDFRRELSKEMNYREHTDVDLLALMQHYGSKTRLIDFSQSPLVALFMAMEQNERSVLGSAGIADRDEEGNRTNAAGLKMAVWAIDLNLMKDSSQEWTEAMESLAESAKKILKNGLRSACDKSVGKSVIPVFPSIGNARLSAQEGLFLMLEDLKSSLMDCLGDVVRADAHFAECGEEVYRRQKIAEVSDATVKSCRAYKFEFAEDAAAVGEALRQLHMSAKTVYPDMEGLAKSMSVRLEVFGNERNLRSETH